MCHGVEERSDVTELILSTAYTLFNLDFNTANFLSSKIVNESTYYSSEESHNSIKNRSEKAKYQSNPVGISWPSG